MAEAARELEQVKEHNAHLLTQLSNLKVPVHCTGTVHVHIRTCTHAHCVKIMHTHEKFTYCRT